MKKKFLALLLVAIMVVSLVPTTVFAGGKSYVITSGTPESAKETNHGYIAIDTTTADKNDTVTVTVTPNEGYQLKALTVTPTGFVDLGIKDAEGKSLYWKETNLGASNPQDPGDYYMWGATALMYSAVDRSKTDGAFTFVTQNPYGDNYKNTWDASLGFSFNNVPFADGVFENNVGKRNVFTKYTTIDTYAKSGTPDNITTLQPEDDAATAENENWRMPTYDELAALATNCVLIWTSDYNSTGNAGYIVYKAKNDADKGKANMNGTWKMWDAANSKYIANTGSEPTGYSTSDIHIFLPAAGSGAENKLNNLNKGGGYWSGTLGSKSDVAYGLTIMNIGIQMGEGQRQYGYTIRPVMNFSGITPAKQTDGTYQFTMPGYAVTVTAEFEVTIANILPSNFPASNEDNSWCNSGNDNVYIYKTDSNLVFNDSTEDIYNISLSSSLTKEENPKVSYVYSKDGTYIQFNMTGDNNDELDSIIVSDCTNISCIGTYAAPEAFCVTYNANGATSGTVPTNQIKTAGVALTLATNTGNLAKAGYTFAGWNTKADGNGTHYDIGATYTTDAALTLYAEWIEAPAPKTIADILPENFPTSSAGGWLNENGGKSYIMNDNLFVYGKTNVELSKSVTKKDDGNYEYQGTSGTKITFVMESGKLTKINVSGSVYPENNGTYVAPHAHTFTYTANNGKLTATCTAGCDKGYDTTPLTLTLTASASLVYDGDAKAFTFANGEADAWETAGLELPTIFYYVKQSGQSTYMPLLGTLKSVGNYKTEITVNEKTAQVEFSIDKATPYIKTNPEPTDIDYGKKLADSTLFGGYVQVSSTNTTQVGGLFEWTNSDTAPGLDDSEVTEYDVTFTPADTNNFNTVSCKVKIKVNHTHTPVLVNGQAATETASGWKDYYKCDCGALFEDTTGNTPIENLDTWKAKGGAGYIPSDKKLADAKTAAQAALDAENAKDPLTDASTVTTGKENISKATTPEEVASAKNAAITAIQAAQTAELASAKTDAKAALDAEDAKDPLTDKTPVTTGKANIDAAATKAAVESAKNIAIDAIQEAQAKNPEPAPKPVEVYYAPLVADLKANEDGVIEWEAGDSLPLEAVKLLVDKPELSLEFTFTYEGEEHTIFIPAGAFEKYYDVTIPWYGPAWLIQYFEKSEKEVNEYTIVSGDTLNALAEKFKCTVEEILALNPYISDKHWIYPNNKLLIPVQK